MERDGIAVSEDLSEKPMLRANLFGYFDAFYDLDTERHHGMGFMRIPWSKIVQYAEFYGMDVEETVYFVRKMDDAHIKHLAEMRTNNGTNPSGSREVVARPPRPD